MENSKIDNSQKAWLHTEIETELMRRFKGVASSSGLTVKAAVVEALDLWIEEKGGDLVAEALAAHLNAIATSAGGSDAD